MPGVPGPAEWARARGGGVTSFSTTCGHRFPAPDARPCSPHPRVSTLSPHPGRHRHSHCPSQTAGDIPTPRSPHRDSLTPCPADEVLTAPYLHTLTSLRTTRRQVSSSTHHDPNDVPKHLTTCVSASNVWIEKMRERGVQRVRTEITWGQELHEGGRKRCPWRAEATRTEAVTPHFPQPLRSPRGENTRGRSSRLPSSALHSG